MTKFDPNAASAKDSGIFGLLDSEAESSLVYLPVPWEVTTSYGGGTSEGPSAILQASRQIDLFDLDVLRPYEAKLHMLPESVQVRNWNETAKALAQQVIQFSVSDEELPKVLAAVNRYGQQLNDYVYQETLRLVKSQKLVGVVGGDHSVPYGALQAISESYSSFGILHFDAHSDTRKAFEGFRWSHASIMYNVLETIPQVTHLVQVGIRDVCEEEVDYIAEKGSRVEVYYDRDLADKKFGGMTWNQISQEIIMNLPQNVWISFDIDGLDPRFCPNTGTPVPGGIDFHEANALFAALVKSGRKVIGFDLNEVSPNLKNREDEWDANVGARMLYKLSAWMLASQGKAKLRK